MKMSANKILKMLRKQGAQWMSAQKTDTRGGWKISFNRIHTVHIFRDMEGRAMAAFNTVIDDKNFTMRCVTGKMSTLRNQLMEAGIMR